MSFEFDYPALLEFFIEQAAIIRVQRLSDCGVVVLESSMIFAVIFLSFDLRTAPSR